VIGVLTSKAIDTDHAFEWGGVYQKHTYIEMVVGASTEIIDGNTVVLVRPSPMLLS
jgi:hypothetical protein